MGKYDNALKHLNAGEIIILPAETNIKSLRRQYNRERNDILNLGGKLSDTSLNIHLLDDGRYEARITIRKSVAFEIVEDNNGP